jgi:endo-1,4-beta-xylanase
MPKNSSFSRRHAFWLGLSTALGMGTAVGDKDIYKRYKTQSLVKALNDPRRSFSVTGNTSLKTRAAAKGLLYGAAETRENLEKDSDLAAQFSKDYDLLVPAWEMKWTAGTSHLRPTPYTFDFKDADWMLAFAQNHNLLLRGHALIWHLALPSWFGNTVNRRNAESFLVNHIQTVVNHFSGKLHSWDVVNEAIAPEDGQTNGLRKTPWLSLLGENYIDLAFRIAAEADPNALLVYNDYGLVYDTPSDKAKRVAVLKMLERLKAQGTPIAAFGIQSHLEGHETRFNPKKLRAFLSDIASLGLKILVTELDVNEQELPADRTLRDRIVASAYEDYLNVVLDEPAVIAVITWGLSDRYTWLSEFAPRSDKLPLRPLPLDANFKRKLAWNAIARAFDHAPVRSKFGT